MAAEVQMADQTLGNIPDGGLWEILTNVARSQPTTWRVPYSLIQDKTRGTQETSMKSPGQWTMKTFSLSSIVLLAFFLSVHLGAASGVSLGGSGSVAPCCLDFSNKMLPWNWVYSYELVKDSCLQKVVIFTTKRGQKVCVQPQAKWVQRYISLLKAQKHL
ncbi:hypothetical protein ACRRTK_008553 [Alexandromys fortis]